MKINPHFPGQRFMIWCSGSCRGGREIVPRTTAIANQPPNRGLVLLLSVFLLVSLSCGLPTKIEPSPAGGNLPAVPGKDPSLHQPTSPAAAQPSPEAGDRRIMFLESDCPTDDAMERRVIAHSGNLSCKYQTEGMAKSFSIKELLDPKAVQEQFAETKNNIHESETEFASKEGAQLDVIQDDSHGYLSMSTYTNPNNISVTHESGICGYGYGISMLDERFLVSYMLSSCSLGNDPDDYIQAFKTLVETANPTIELARNR